MVVLVSSSPSSAGLYTLNSIRTFFIVALLLANTWSLICATEQINTDWTSPPKTVWASKRDTSSLYNDKTYTLKVVLVERVNNMCAGANKNTSNFSASPCLNNTSDNATGALTSLPKHLYFSDDNIVSVAAYSCLFVVAACGNLTVFITLFRNRSTKSRINLFIMHLAIADLIVTFVMLPLEIAWNATVAWLAGDIACRLLTFFRAIGFYLSSFILVSISLDRYFAIMRPLSITDADARARMMLMVSWSLSIIASIPQLVCSNYPSRYSFLIQAYCFHARLLTTIYAVNCHCSSGKRTLFLNILCPRTFGNIGTTPVCIFMPRMSSVPPT
ncbi:unnamed protein product [Candidula unifasciata]|uniref:G-protein coupled receptors family 1 profile domain-containing protein n=1 Tax=Candidula unifasciata TaxID=100452 RepID=A0A8S3ZNL7_9EUPU|nr:unnamed protein product [Candidula unifasciata]